MKFFLYPLSWLYGIGISIRNGLFDLNLLKSKEFDVPVISVGNITVGGTGKTPHVEYLVQLLCNRFEIASLSRGYKRKTKGFRYVETNSTVLEVGDEPLQIKNRFPQITVSVCENRVVGVEKLLHPDTEKMPDVVLLDDAFQHRRITPGLNILLIDYNRPIKKDSLLPAGRLRERIAQMRRANIIIITKCPDDLTPIMRRIFQKDVGLKPYQKLFFTAMKYEMPEPVFSGKPLTEPSFINKSYSVVIVTGIASPMHIQNYLKQYSKKTVSISFPDHHYYTSDDLQKIMQKFEALNGENKIIITTEKDAMRWKDRNELPEEFKNSLYFLPMRVKFLDDEGKEFNTKILNYVGENKSNRELHKRKNKGNT